jgi:hypothetical protein
MAFALSTSPSASAFLSWAVKAHRVTTLKQLTTNNIDFIGIYSFPHQIE